MSLNLHALANVAVAAVHPNETVRLIRALGCRLDHGRRLPDYADPVSLTAQVQGVGGDRVAQSTPEVLNGAPQRKFWLTAAGPPATLPGPASRAYARPGDYLYREDGTLWKVTELSDDYHRSGWIALTAVQQPLDPQLRALLEPKPAPDIDDQGWIPVTLAIRPSVSQFT